MKTKIIKAFLLWFLCEAFFVFLFVSENSVFALFGALFLFLLTFTSFLSAFFARKSLSAEVILPVTAEKKNGFSGKIIIENCSAFPVFNAVAILSVKNKLTGENEEIEIPFFALPKSKSERNIYLSSEFCGYISAKISGIYLFDLFGFLPLKTADFSSSKARLTVLPETFPIKIVFDKIPPVPEDSESYSPYKKGNDQSEIFQIREYSDGDSVRQIHWKLSEKLDKLVVKDASLPVAKNILLFWKKAWENSAPKEIDSMAEVVSSLSEGLLSAGFEFVLGWDDGNKTEFSEIKSSENLAEAIPKMIKYGADSSEKSEEKENFSGFGKIIFVAKSASEYIEKLPEGTNFVVCNKTESGSKIINFSPEKYSEELEFLEL